MIIDAGMTTILGPESDVSKSNNMIEHKYDFDEYTGIYSCDCGKLFSAMEQVKEHLDMFIEKPDLQKFLSLSAPRASLKYASKFPNWYISAETEQIARKIKDIIEIIPTEVRTLPILQNSWACYNFKHRVIGCVKCHEQREDCDQITMRTA
eukprot:UN27948